MTPSVWACAQPLMLILCRESTSNAQCLVVKLCRLRCRPRRAAAHVVCMFAKWITQQDLALCNLYLH